MKTKVVFFGMIAERLGMEDDMIDLSSFFNTDSAPVEVFKKLYPELEQMTFQVAVDRDLNGAITATTTEIALLPPFAGG